MGLTIMTGDDVPKGCIYTLDEMRVLEKTGHSPVLSDKWRLEAARMHEREQKIRDEIREAMRPQPTDCSRCGACCLRFTLPWSYQECRENFDAWLDGRKYVDEVLYQGKNVTVGGPCQRRVHDEVARWFPALVPLDPERAMRGLVFRAGITLDQHPHWYACRHVSVVDGFAHCGVHETRPYTCHAYKPKSQGGYLADPEMIYHQMCSYRTDHDWIAEQAWINFDRTQCLNRPVIRDGGRIYDHCGRTVVGGKHPAGRTIIYDEID
jgi:Fe-S-cluster containining protein